MVHESTRSDMWYHDTMTDFCTLANYVHWAEFRDLDKSEPSYIWEGSVKRNMNPDNLTLIERGIRGMEKEQRELEARFNELLTLDKYNVNHNIITPEEFEKGQIWNTEAMEAMNEIVKRFRGFRAHKSMSPEEHKILFDHIQEHVTILRELLRDRYEVEQEVERREEILKVLGT
jgi:hypothetical protein